MDWEFECIFDSLLEEEKINTTTTNEHVIETEHKKHVLKESKRALIRTSPFKNIPGQIIIKPIYFVGLWINQESSDNGVSDVYSTQNIIMVQDIYYEKHCKFIFETYIESHKYFKITNDME